MNYPNKSNIVSSEFITGSDHSLCIANFNVAEIVCGAIENRIRVEHQEEIDRNF